MGYEKQGFADGQKLFASNLIAIEEGIINAESTSAHFVGEIFAYAGEGTPPGCLPCDGRAVSRSEYWELFDAIGTTYGAGDGSSTFNLPNIESRTIIGESDSYALGATGGEKKHTLTTAELPKNYASFTVRQMGGSNTVVAQSNASSVAVSGNYSSLAYSGTESSAQKITFTGSGSAHNNMQPYIVMRYFITTGKGDPVSGINPADYVVEWKANDDGWYWEKWASGKAYCRKRTLVSWTTGVSSWGNTYESMVLYTNGDYPFEFAEVPVADVYIEGSGTGNYMNGTRTAGGVFGTTTSSPQVYLQNDNSSSDYDKGGYLVTEAEGWWKTPPEAGGTETIAPTIAERFIEQAKAKTWVFAIRDRNNQETQAGSSAAAGWFNTTCGYKIAGTDDWEDYFYTSTSSISITLKKPGVYRCVFRIHGKLSAASRLGAGWFQGSTEMASDWIYTGSTNACTVVTELILNVEEETSIIPKIYASGVTFTKYVGGHLTNFTIEYLGEL